MLIKIRRIGNSKGIIIPTSILAQLGVETEVDVSVVDGAIVVRVPAKPNRSGWSDASKSIALVGDDALVMPEFANVDDAVFSW
jgi:antitoxin MazE